MHGRAELAAVLEQRGDLRLLEAGDGLDVVGLLGLPEQQRVRPVRRCTLFGEEVRIARGDDAVGDEKTGVAMIGMQPVTAPRIVSEQHVGSNGAYPVRNLPTLPQARFQLAVRPS